MLYEVITDSGCLRLGREHDGITYQAVHAADHVHRVLVIRQDLGELALADRADGRKVVDAVLVP